MKPRLAPLALTLAAALAATGCGEKCPTETPRVDEVASCSTTPGATVTVNLRLCPTCNQSPTTCSVDLSGASAGQIHLDPVSEACESSSSCPPGCDRSGVACTFQAPSVAGTYTMLVFDPQTSSTRTGTLTVGSAAPSCTF